MATPRLRLDPVQVAALFSLMLGAALIGTSPVSAQSLRAPSADSVAAGPTSNRNSLATPQTTGLPGVTARQSTLTGTGAGSAVSILGMPVHVAAPVTAPYNSQAAYDTFASQPMRGRDSVLRQSIDGAP